MRRIGLIVACCGVFAAPLVAGTATAQKQPARAQAPIDEAKSYCQQYVGRNVRRGGGPEPERSAQFKACMERFGYPRY